ncbi:hypothetical protein LK464_15040 [Mycobacteroides abscessus subsp. abscessus]|uniref:hypothetical protein n=1 Tax=Mycobacteroides abscessus TaxID=36809 RepID=UPI001896A4CE|nr:hypothetical protein [Mycobacteroides abscessus]UEA22798.1 hypothetical protein LK464_15040 [Mycobacteroides abscessus subsp. abscessus]
MSDGEWKAQAFPVAPGIFIDGDPVLAVEYDSGTWKALVLNQFGEVVEAAIDENADDQYRALSGVWKRS